MEAAATQAVARNATKRLNVFERWLSLWVVLCTLVGVALGKLLPGFTDALRRLEFGEGSQINVPIAVLLWLMIYPMMLRIDLASVLGVRRRPRGILVTLFVNWLVKPLLDVFDREPLAAGSVLADAPNLILTPHIAGVTIESNERVSGIIAERVAAYLCAKGPAAG